MLLIRFFYSCADMSWQDTQLHIWRISVDAIMNPWNQLLLRQCLASHVLEDWRLVYIISIWTGHAQRSDVTSHFGHRFPISSALTYRTVSWVGLWLVLSSVLSSTRTRNELGSANSDSCRMTVTGTCRSIKFHGHFPSQGWDKDESRDRQYRPHWF